MKKIIVISIWLLLVALQGEARVQDFTVVAPIENGHAVCNDDSPTSPLTDLKELRVYVKYFTRPDTIMAKVLLCNPGDTLRFSMEMGYGVMGYVFVKAVDRSNNKSCMGPTYTFAIPCSY